MTDGGSSRYPTDNALVERADEQRAIARFVAGDGSAALVISGEAGCGKSTLWGLGVASAVDAGVRVLSTRAAQAETSLSFAGLADLLGRVGTDPFAHLPEVQRSALDAALLRAPGTGTMSPRTIATAVTSVLRDMSGEQPVLVAIDDLHWLDDATTDALGFALRRLPVHAVRVLATVRTESALTPSAGTGTSTDRIDSLRAALPPGSVDTLHVPPCSPELLGSIIRQRLGRTLSAPVLEQLHDRTGGNPFWAIEAVRAARDVAGPVDLPESLAGTVATRLRALPADVRVVLATVAALSHPTPELVERGVDGRVVDATAAVDAAVATGVVEYAGGRLRPAHPVLGSVALDLLLPSQRTSLHRRLADVVGDAEQRARHLAVATAGTPSAELAAELDTGATAAQARGAIRSAASLAELAVTATPAADPIAR
ncbi:MAG TPA: AAA family ATPase, partial [Nocardioides sp.]|nr:AAA family ATPase [Nocardioides sp.]